ncbi:cytochrome ubiquinol oxidase subunit I, partial [Acinetobacter baumannii]
VMGPAGYVAMLAGWITTEVGRQPWVVYGIMRTKDGLSHTVSADQVGLSLFIFVVVYTIVFGSGIYYTLKLINKGPVFIDTPNMEAGGVGHFKTPMRPLSAVDENIDSKQNSGENRHD